MSHFKGITPVDIKKIIKLKDINFVKLQFVDLNGHVKNVSVPSKQIDKILNNEITLDGSSIKGFRNIETSDMLCFPDLETFSILPWNPDSVRIICDIYNPEGTPFEGCPRNNLKNVIKKIQKLGYTINIGPECEFFLFKKNEDNTLSTISHDSVGYYDAGPGDLGENIRDEMVKNLQQMGFDIEASHHEVAKGQHEIGFKYADALTTADNAVTFKLAVKTIASLHGLHATFMPKPIHGINGSGMHTNFSLTKNKKNVFFDSTQPNQLSKESLWAIGGILKHIKEITAVCNPTVNSYKRLVTGFEAPTYLAWSESNRSALLRIPAKRGADTRLELRSPDSSCNPYLSFAVISCVAINGIINQILPPAPLNKDIYKLSYKEKKNLKVESLPNSLFDAIYFMEKSSLVKESLGSHIFNEFLKAKKIEWNSFRSYVTSWEIEQYLETI